jgi:predicted nucleotidyltransferase
MDALVARRRKVSREPERCVSSQISVQIRLTSYALRGNQRRDSGAQTVSDEIGMTGTGSKRRTAGIADLLQGVERLGYNLRFILREKAEL